jgi:NADH:ubiquinone oxidoreductase subunit F (NADH-binding)
VEGCAIGAYAISAETAYVYIAEVHRAAHWMEQAVKEAYAAGILATRWAAASASMCCPQRRRHYISAEKRLR